MITPEIQQKIDAIKQKYNYTPKKNNDWLAATAPKPQPEAKPSLGEGTWAKTLLGAPATMLARPVQAGAMLLGAQSEDVNKVTENLTGGLVSPVPENMGDLYKDAGRAVQTASLGLGPVSGGASFMAGNAMEQGDANPLSVGTQATIGAVGGKIIPIIGAPIFNTAGKVLGKVTPQFLKDIVAKGGQKLVDFAEAHNVLPKEISDFVNKSATGIENIANKPFDMVSNTVSSASKNTINQLKGYVNTKVQKAISDDVDNLLKATRSIGNKTQEATIKNVDIASNLKDPQIFKGIKVEKGKINPDEAIAAVQNRIDTLMDAKREMLPEIDRLVPEINRDVIRQKAIEGIKGKYTPLQEKRLMDSINAEVDELPLTLKPSSIDDFRAKFRSSARDAKGMQKSSSEYSALENAARDTVFDVTDSLPVSGAQEYKALNDYVKNQLVTKEFLDKTLRNQGVKGQRLGVYAAKTIGAIAGSSHGVLGAIAGSEVGGVVADIITNNTLGSSMKMRLIKNITSDPVILTKAQKLLGDIKNINVPLLSAPKVGSPRTTTYGNKPIELPSKTASTIEAQELGNPNISRQNTANTMMTKVPNSMSSTIPQKKGILQKTKNFLNSPQAKRGFIRIGTGEKPQLVNLPKRSLSSLDETTPLLQEAKKYKSAEEFVKAQTNAQHGTNANFTEFKKVEPSKGEAIYLSDKGQTKASAIASNGGKLMDVVVDESRVKTFDPRSNNLEINNIVQKAFDKIHGKGKYIYDPTAPVATRNIINKVDDVLQSEVIRQASKLGYNDFRFYEPSTREYSRAITDNSLIKTKSQLTDIWNKANKK